MLFGRTFIFCFFYFFLPCDALRCTTNCDYTHSFTQPFSIPDQCNQIVSAGKCHAHLTFKFHTQQYNVQFKADPSRFVTAADNRRHAYMSLSQWILFYFPYKVYYGCKNKDDCARDLARNGVNEILQRQYNFPGLINELTSLISSPPLTPNNLNLKCYDSKENVLPCGTSPNRGSCVIEHTIRKNTFNRSCDAEAMVDTVFVSMFQSESHITFEFACNQSLCNTPSTLQAVKDIMFKYNVTATLDGRLVNTGNIVDYGSKLLVLILLTINMSHRLLLT